MNQKLLITLTVISLSFTAFLSGYLISQKDFHRNSSSNSSGNILDKFSDTLGSTDLSISSPSLLNNQTLKLLSPRRVISPTISQEKDGVIFYEKDTGKVFEIDLQDLREKSVSNVPLNNLIKTVWAPSRKEVVSLFYSPKGNRYQYFNYKTKSYINLGANIKSLTFSPDGSQVIYFGGKDSSQGIFISQPDGSSFKKILPSRLENVEIYWPLDELISFKTETPGGSELYSLSKTGEVKKLIDSKGDLDVKWSKDGSEILFSQQTESGIGLFYKNASSESETPLNVSTSASKCDWSIDDKTIVCGIPRSSGSGDEFYEIDLDGTKKLLSSPTSRINTAELFLSGLDDYVVILNSLDDKLYVLKK